MTEEVQTFVVLPSLLNTDKTNDEIDFTGRDTDRASSSS